MSGPIRTNRILNKIWIGLAGFTAMGVYLLVSQIRIGLGFPLDDAWIHQTYARNLAQFGEWAFIHGSESGGSTAPLWTFLISIGYFFSRKALLWTYFLGWVALCLTGILGEKIFRKLHPESHFKFPLIGLFLIFEWHLVWAAVSGMETILLAGAVLLLYWLILNNKKNWKIIGLVIGISVWIRPDAITLLGPSLLAGFLMETSKRERIKACLQISGFFLAGFIPYLIFNQLTCGSIWPNTFYAKQAEYQELTEVPILKRVFQLISLPMVGAGILLLPGTLYFGVMCWRRRNWAGLGMFIWWIGYTLIYAVRLPVTYQHGRYLIPAMPIYFLSGLSGSFLFIEKIRSESRWRFVLRMSWQVVMVITLVLFYILGSTAYANDVGIIETEMVQTAQWVNGHLPESSVIAAHDIGALGFFGGHYIVDLAGLISPEVIPIIRDEDALADFLLQHNVEYLITFPDWYPDLIKRGKEIYNSQGKFSPDQGGENMAVFELLLPSIPAPQP